MKATTRPRSNESVNFTVTQNNKWSYGVMELTDLVNPLQFVPKESITASAIIKGYAFNGTDIGQVGTSLPINGNDVTANGKPQALGTANLADPALAGAQFFIVSNIQEKKETKCTD